MPSIEGSRARASWSVIGRSESTLPLRLCRSHFIKKPMKILGDGTHYVIDFHKQKGPGCSCRTIAIEPPMHWEKRQGTTRRKMCLLSWRCIIAH